MVMPFRRRDLLVGAAGAAAGIGGLVIGASLWKPRSVTDLASQIHFRLEGSARLVDANGLPGHEIGDFPNAHDPIPVRAQSHHLKMPARPIAGEQTVPLGMWWFGIAVNGIPFDPSAPSWKGDVATGWQFEVLHPANALSLGIDRNNAHTQRGGLYHYHGLPAGLLSRLASESGARAMLLVGYAADGFPIYGPEAPADAEDPESPRRRLRPSYRLSDRPRPGGPGGRCDGRFVEDYLYEPEFGDLDQCNGRRGPTPEYPDGTYYYVLTDSFPFIPRTFRGIPDPTFRHGPPPGVSAPLPWELRHYRSS